jgi:D-amino-acid oxidase
MHRTISFLKPPRLDVKHLGTKTICYRPTRQHTPAMNATKIGTQILANHYGHAGFGWIMAPGSTPFVLDQLETLLPTNAQSLAITVIGGGVIGLTAAYQLTQRGYTHITVIAEQTANLTSHKAVGFFSPSIDLGRSWMTEEVQDMLRASYLFYTEIMAGINPYFSADSALLLPMYTTKPQKSAVSLSPHPVEETIVDFGTGAHHPMLKQEGGLLINVSLMMRQLRAILEKRGVHFVTEKITDLAAVDSPVIINCTGLGAAELVHDTGVVPTQGHLLHLIDQPAEALEYLIMMDHSKARTGSGFQVKRSLYLAPRQQHDLDLTTGILGTTSIKGATVATPHHAEFDVMLENAYQFFYGAQ